VVFTRTRPRCIRPDRTLTTSRDGTQTVCIQRSQPQPPCCHRTSRLMRVRVASCCCHTVYNQRHHHHHLFALNNKVRKKQQRKSDKTTLVYMRHYIRLPYYNVSLVGCRVDLSLHTLASCSGSARHFIYNHVIPCFTRIIPIHLHRVRKKGTDSILAVTLTNLDNFSYFFCTNHPDNT